MRALVLAATLVGALTSAGAARQAEQPGQRMRMTLEPGTPVPPDVQVSRQAEFRWQAPSQDRVLVEGTFAGQDHDSLWVDPVGEADPFAVSWGRIVTLERHAGTQRDVAAYALGFAVPGAAAGALLGAAFCSGDHDCARGTGANAALWGAVVGAGSAVLGALVGAAVTSDRWIRVEAPLVVEPTVIEGRLGASITLRF